MHRIFLLLVGLLSPFGVFAQAQHAGTANYLIETLGYTQDELTQQAITENRQAFDRAIGEKNISDPIGDVLDRLGVLSHLSVPWGDIEHVRVEKNQETRNWIVTTTLAQPVPARPTFQVQLFVYMDADPGENEDAGIRANMDREFSYKYNPTTDWHTGYRWYNPEPQFWAQNKTTAATAQIENTQIIMEIPFEEVPSDLSPPWRVVMAVSDTGGRTQVDAAPTVGFPPPVGEQPRKAPSVLNPSLGIVLGLTVALLVVIFGCVAYKKRRS